MKYGSLFSGIEAASCAWHPLGWEPAFFAEVEPFPSAVLKQRFPEVPNLGDVTKFKEWPDANLDVLVGGSPCQSFSVAGLRKGLDDPRGNLMLTYLAIAGRYRPRWILWENVPGVLSADKGRAFATFLGGLAELGYGFAYRVLDAQHFGVPQRRRRVFVVGYLGDWRRAAAVLFERESLSGDSAPRREARETTSHSLSPCLGASGRGFSRTGDTRGQDAVVAEVSQTLRNHPRPGSNSVGNIVAPTLEGRAGRSGATNFHTSGGLVQTFCPEISPSLDSKGPSSDGDGDGAPLIAPSLRAGGFDASEDGTGRGTPLVTTLAIRGRGDSCDLEIRDDGTANALLAPGGGRGGVGVGVGAIAIQERAVQENAEAGPQGAGYREDDQAYTLEARPVPQAVAFDLRNVTSVANRSNPQPGDPHHTLHKPADSVLTFGWNKSAAQTLRVDSDVAEGLQSSSSNPAIAFSVKDHGADAGDQSPTLRSMGHAGSHANGGGQVGVASCAMQVRRITPREAERLQGFPDEWTAITYRKKPAADGPRYKALGNSMAVPVMAWIGSRIALVDALRSTEQEKSA